MHTLKHRTLALIMSLVMILSCFAGMSFSVGAETSGDYEYEVLDDGTVATTKYLGSDKEVIIPSEIDGKKVTEIGFETFGTSDRFQYFDTKLVGVKIPDTVTTIGN